MAIANRQVYRRRRPAEAVRCRCVWAVWAGTCRQWWNSCRRGHHTSSLVVSLSVAPCSVPPVWRSGDDTGRTFFFAIKKDWVARTSR